MPRLVVRDKTLPPRLRKVALLPRARFGLSAVKGARVDAAASADGADGKSRPFPSAVHDARKPDLGVGVTGGGGSGGGGEHVPEPLRIYEQPVVMRGLPVEEMLTPSTDVIMTLSHRHISISSHDTIESMPHAEVIYYRLICQVGERVGASSSAAQQLKPQLTLASLYSICVAWLLVGGSTMIWLLRQTSRRCHDACRAVRKRRAARVVVLLVLMMPGISATALVPTPVPIPMPTQVPIPAPTAYPILWSDHDITDITSTTGSNVNSAVSADVDGDGDADVLSSAGGWYENLGREPGSGGSWSYHTIAMSPNAVDSVYAVDIDGDGDVDAVSADYGTATVMWYENLDGSGGSWSTHTISTAATAAWSVFAIDIDGDGDSDVVLASYHINIGTSTTTTTVSWYENLDGSGGSWSSHVIYTAAVGARSVHGIDVDGDGDIDVLSAAYVDHTIAWYENRDGSGASWSYHEISTAAYGPYWVTGIDLDGDGDVDVLSASETSGVIALHENLDGSGGSWGYLVIDSTANGAHGVFSVDVDDDGDLDVLAALAYENTIAWYENIDNSGGSWVKHEISTTSNNPNSVIGVDIDGDSDIDVLSVASSTIAWYVSACVLIASLFVLSGFDVFDACRSSGTSTGPSHQRVARRRSRR